MIKKIVALVLILASAGGWFYLDMMNKQEIAAAEAARQEMEAMRAKARALAAARAKFEAQILAELTTCKEEAEKAKEAFLEANKKPVKRKPGQFTIAQNILDEAAATLETATATCQSSYDTRLTNGQ